MGETFVNKGTSKISGSVAYVEQEPFIYPGSVKDNILFGLKYNESLLDRAIELSQLTRDLKNFGRGVETIIGERGINVSGGQKARISLARAIYSNANILLFDDPLSAVDPKVSHDIFFKCIKEGCKDKIVVLATHQI